MIHGLTLPIDSSREFSGQGTSCDSREVGNTQRADPMKVDAVVMPIATNSVPRKIVLLKFTQIFLRLQ
jgi:hypothetical protein